MGAFLAVGLCHWRPRDDLPRHRPIGIRMTAGVSESPSAPSFYEPRAWLNEWFREWLASSDAPRIVNVKGPLGTGKSRFLHAMTRSTEAGDHGAVLGLALLRDRKA